MGYRRHEPPAVSGQVWRSKGRWEGPVVYIRVLGVVGELVAVTPLNGSRTYGLMVRDLLKGFELVEGDPTERQDQRR